MGIFEDVLLNARSAVDTVGKKAGKVIDTSKLKIAAAKQKQQAKTTARVLTRSLRKLRSLTRN